MSAPVQVSAEQYLEGLARSQLLDAATVNGLTGRLQSGQLPEEATALASALVREGHLTRFQAKTLLLGKPRSFFIGGKFKMLEPLGTGGMGTVYLCEHLMMRRLVAVKVLPPAAVADRSLLERFFREARAVAALAHPNLVRAYDADRAGDMHFLVMEFVDGVSLQQLVQSHGPLSMSRAAHYIAQAALGLQHAHEAGWVHRDIKPGNILLDRNGTVKLLDLGLARLFTDKADNLTQQFDSQATLGTADYLPPEQAMDIRSVDIRGDLYSLGATLYFTLTGRAPFGDKTTTAQKLVAHQMLDPTPLRQLRPEVPARLASVVERLMRKNPAERFMEPRELVQALDPWTQEPLPPPASAEMPRWPKAIADLAAASDPKLSKPAAITVSNRSQLTKPLRPTPAAATPSSVSRRPDPEPRKDLATVSQKVRPAKSGSGKAKRKPKRPRGLPPALVYSAIGLTLLTAVSVLVWASWPKRDEPADLGLPSSPVAQAPNRDSTRPLVSGGRSSPSPAATSTAVAAGNRLDPRHTLYVATDRSTAPAGAQRVFTTVREALTQAKPGEAMMVLDEIIREALLLDDGTTGRRVTLIGQRPDGKRVIWQPPAGHGGEPIIRVSGLAGFTLRGFQLDGNDDQAEAILSIQGACPGLRFEDLHLTQFKNVGIELRGAQGETDDPITFRRLRIESGKKNQRLAAVLFEAGERGVNQHVLFTDSRIDGFFQSLFKINGSLTYATVKNNRFLIQPMAVAKSTKPHQPSDGFLIENATKLRLTIANNTFLRFNYGIHLPKLPQADAQNRIVFRNNLILNMQGCVQVGTAAEVVEEAATVALFPNFEGNLCRPSTCTGGVPFLRPTSRNDIDRLFDNPDDDRTFLRYEAGSKLMTAGAGGEPVGAPPN